MTDAPHADLIARLRRLPEGDDEADLRYEAATALEQAHAHVAQARNAVLEECAKLADGYGDHVLHVYSRGPNSPPGNQRIPLHGSHIAAAIRGMKTDNGGT